MQNGQECEKTMYAVAFLSLAIDFVDLSDLNSLRMIPPVALGCVVFHLKGRVRTRR